MKVLLVQHMQDHWGNLDISKNDEEHSSKWGEKVLDFILRTPDINKIILTVPKNKLQKINMDDYGSYKTLKHICKERDIQIDIHDYDPLISKDWGYSDVTENINWCKSSRKDTPENEVVKIPTWNRLLKNDDTFVYLAGAFNNGAVQDMEDALKTLDVPFQKIEGLVVDSGVNYKYQYKSSSQLWNEYTDAAVWVDDYEDITEKYNHDEKKIIKNALPLLVNAEKIINKFVEDNREILKTYNIVFEEHYKPFQGLFVDALKNGESTKYADMLDAKNLETIKSKLSNKDDKIEDVKAKKTKKHKM